MCKRIEVDKHQMGILLNKECANLINKIVNKISHVKKVKIVLLIHNDTLTHEERPFFNNVNRCQTIMPRFTLKI